MGEIFICDGCGRDTTSTKRLCSRCTGLSSNSYDNRGLIGRKSPSIDESRRNIIRELVQRSESTGWAYDDGDEGERA